MGDMGEAGRWCTRRTRRGDKGTQGHGGQRRKGGQNGLDDHGGGGGQAPRHPPSPARLIGGASTRRHAGSRRGPLVPGLGRRPRQARPASRPPPWTWTRAGSPLRSCGGQREAPGRAGPSRVRSTSHLRLMPRCAGVPAAARSPTPRPFGRGVRRPNPRRPHSGWYLSPGSVPQCSASRAGSTAAAAEAAARPPGGAGTWEGGAAAPGARPQGPTSGREPL